VTLELLGVVHGDGVVEAGSMASGARMQWPATATSGGRSRGGALVRTVEDGDVDLWLKRGNRGVREVRLDALIREGSERGLGTAACHRNRPGTAASRGASGGENLAAWGRSGECGEGEMREGVLGF
jgi:hypothetical protein